MFLTDLIKYPPYKEFLINNFPKPITPVMKEKQVPNSNPSLTGYAFEILFHLIKSNNLEIEKILESQFKAAEKNLKFLNEKKINLSGHKNKRYIKVRSIVYTEALKEIKLIIKLPGHYFEKNITERSVEIYNYSILNLYDLQKKIGLPILNNEGQNILIYDGEILHKSYKSFFEKFKKEASLFLASNLITKKFTLVLLQFTHLSSPYFRLCEPISNIKFNPQYLSYIFNHFKDFANQTQIKTDSITTKPSLTYLGIKATPDFLINQKLSDLKTSKSFFSSIDYFQAISYLIFAQQEDNIKKFGIINSIIIYYSCFNKQIEIAMKDFKYNSKIKKELNEIIVKFKRQRQY